MKERSGAGELEGRVALVVGAAGFLGSRFAAVLAGAGARVHAADRTTASRAAERARRSRPVDGVAWHRADVTRPKSVERLVEAVVARDRRIDVLVYAATAKPEDFYAAFTACSLEGWREILRVELDGLFLVAQAVGAVMERQSSGSIVLLSSIYGVVGNDQRIYRGANLESLYAKRGRRKGGGRVHSHAGYAAAKGGVASMARFLAAYWGERGIRVNALSPGGIAHPGENRRFVRNYSERAPLGRKAAPEELDGALLFLASDASSYVTGHNLLVDGGWTAW